MSNEQQDNGQPQRNPNDVLFHAAPGGLYGPEQAQALMKNSILTPASSITS